MHNLLEILILTLRNFINFPILRYLGICNVLCIWSVRAIPTYRVYRLYDSLWHCQMRAPVWILPGPLFFQHFFRCHSALMLQKIYLTGFKCNRQSHIMISRYCNNNNIIIISVSKNISAQLIRVPSTRWFSFNTSITNDQSNANVILTISLLRDVLDHRSYRLRNQDWKLLTWAIESIGAIHVAQKTTKMHKNCEKNTNNGQKSHIFPILLTIATKQKHLQPYNLAILVDKAFF